MGLLNSAALIRSPRSEFPFSESIIKKIIEVNSAVNPPTMAIVPNNREGRRSLRSSAMTTRIICSLLSFQRTFLRALAGPLISKPELCPLQMPSD